MHLTHSVRKRALTAYRAAYVARWRGRPYVSDASPIIIGGCPRSGTTLMRVMLDTHSRICCGPECSLLLPRWPHVRNLARRFVIPEGAIQALFKTSRSQGWFADEFFKLYCATLGKPRWAEKTVANIHHLDFIFSRFPKASFIHVIRDGRDTVCSLRTHPRHKVVNGQLVKLNTRHPLEPCVQRWVDYVQAGLKHRSDPRYLEVRYEDLVANPRATLERVFAFVGEQFEERVLDFHAVEGGSRDSTNNPQNPEANQPVYTKAISRWRADFSAGEVDTFKRVGGSLLVQLHYAQDNNW
jgi:protein-tyrosine sulfotransferase